jgi:phosphoribosylaminoimidazolecarboxamide formyltransferase/IMP cyclohydrolase
MELQPENRKLLATKIFMFLLIMTLPFLTTSIDRRNNLQSIADGQVLRYGENPHQKAFSLVI